MHKNKLKIAFLCSGGGGNLKFINAAISQSLLTEVELSLVVADRDCPAFNYAKLYSIEAIILDFTDVNQLALINILLDHNVDLVITTVHRILKQPLVDKFRGRLVNLHYSLLPAYAGTIGARPVKDAMRYGNRLVGVTAHHVNILLDQGEPIAQLAFGVHPGEEFDEILDLVFRAGCIVLFRVVSGFCDERFRGDSSVFSKKSCCIMVGNREGLIAPAVSLPDSLSKEEFWIALKS